MFVFILLTHNDFQTILAFHDTWVQMYVEWDSHPQADTNLHIFMYVYGLIVSDILRSIIYCLRIFGWQRSCFSVHTLFLATRVQISPKWLSCSFGLLCIKYIYSLIMRPWNHEAKTVSESSAWRTDSDGPQLRCLLAADRQISEGVWTITSSTAYPIMLPPPS